MTSTARPVTIYLVLICASLLGLATMFTIAICSSPTPPPNPTYEKETSTIASWTTHPQEYMVFRFAIVWHNGSDERVGDGGTTNGAAHLSLTTPSTCMDRDLPNCELGKACEVCIGRVSSFEGFTVCFSVYERGDVSVSVIGMDVFQALVDVSDKQSSGEFIVRLPSRPEQTPKEP